MVTTQVPVGLMSWGSLMFGFCPRDLKVSNLLMTDKGCVKTGGCWVPALWPVSVGGYLERGAGQCLPVP